MYLKFVNVTMRYKRLFKAYKMSKLGADQRENKIFSEI